MLVIKVEEQEFFDEKQELFLQTKPVVVRMEHSLISISKWESYWEKPYLGTEGVVKGVSGHAEEMHYIQCMILGVVPTHIPEILFHNHIKEISAYISKQHTATSIQRRMGHKAVSRQVITTELVYYWMIKLGIPLECQKWHFNRLLMLIDVCNVKDTPGKNNRLTTAEANKYITDLNKKRRGL
jgi:hypothetical protein